VFRHVVAAMHEARRLSICQIVANPLNRVTSEYVQILVANSPPSQLRPVGQYRRSLNGPIQADPGRFRLDIL